MSKSIKNIAIFASGNGTNAMNLLELSNGQLKTISIKCLITDNEQAGVIAKIRNHKIFHELPLYIIPFLKHEEEPYSVAKERHEKKISKVLNIHQIDWITLAGYMRILSSSFLEDYFDEKLQTNRVINIHPSLLPKYPGKDAYEQAYNSGDTQSGVTVHFVDGGVDTGPIILQKTFKRNPHDTLQDFKMRGLNLEYQIYKEALINLDKQ
jgi:phosphoribosylglycinamide formyltransferase 1